MPIPFLDLRAQYESIKEEIDAAIREVIQRSAFALGPAVEEFETAFASYCGTKHCVGLNSGTAALTLLLRAYGIGKGDEVITVANTFFATVESILHVGATPALVDCEESTALMDPQKIEAAITQKTKAIIPVHLYGQCADMDAINAIARKHHLIVIEDACQAHGARYRDKRAGSLGHSAAFSFYPGKNLGAFGEAGAVITNDEHVAKTIRMLRDHGQSKKYHHDTVGWNERMDGIQGAVLNVKLKHLDAWNAKRREHAEKYRDMLSNAWDIRFFSTRHAEPVALRIPQGDPELLERVEAHRGAESAHVHHLFVIRTSKRDTLQQHLKNQGIDTGIHYPIPIHLLGAMKSYGWKAGLPTDLSSEARRAKGEAPRGAKVGSFPTAEKLANEILSLPMYPELTEGQIGKVCHAIKTFF